MNEKPVKIRFLARAGGNFECIRVQVHMHRGKKYADGKWCSAKSLCKKEAIKNASSH